jgi:ABC-2 type transport system permease protein
MTIEAVPTVSGWRTGAGNVFRHESRLWWRTKRWWIQALLWTAILNLILLGMLWVASEANQGNLRLEEPAMGAADVFPQFVGLALLLSTIGVVVLTQGAILDERRAGTLEWVLAKPVSRTGMVIAKFWAHALPVLAVFVVLPWAVIYLQLSQESSEPWPVGEFMLVVALIALVHLFTVALVLMLGTWTTSRALVVGLPIGIAIMYDSVHLFLDDMAGRLPFPWELGGAATRAAAGEPLVSVVPVVATVLWVVTAMAVAAWRFQRDDIL